MPGDCKAESDEDHPEGGKKKVLQDGELVGTAAERDPETHVSGLERGIRETHEDEEPLLASFFSFSEKYVFQQVMSRLKGYSSNLFLHFHKVVGLARDALKQKSEN